MCFDVKRFFVFAGAGVGTKMGASSGAWTQSACVCVVCVCRAPKNKFATNLWMRLQIFLLFVCVVWVRLLAFLLAFDLLIFICCLLPLTYDSLRIRLLMHLPDYSWMMAYFEVFTLYISFAIHLLLLTACH